MGRKRKDGSQGLPPRVYLRSGSFYYVHPSGKWENIGKDLAAAQKRAEHYQDPAGRFGTMAWFLDQFLIECGRRVAAGDLSARTLQDYTGNAVALKAMFGDMMPTEITAAHVTHFLDTGLAMGRAVCANREKACLSSCLSWMLRTGQGGLVVNPCMRRSGVVRNTERQRERYVTDAEYQAVFKAAPLQVQLLMELTYRTLQRPESDIIHWTPAIVKAKGDGRVLRIVQNKTKRQVDIGLVDPLDSLMRRAMGAVPVLHQPIVHTREGEGYTYDGISAMLRRVVKKVRETVPALKDMASFGFRDLKGKGATDMWLAGEPLERIQLLCGHASKMTTEKYVKARWSETVLPNGRDVAA